MLVANVEDFFFLSPQLYLKPPLRELWMRAVLLSGLASSGHLHLAAFDALLEPCTPTSTLGNPRTLLVPPWLFLAYVFGRLCPLQSVFFRGLLSALPAPPSHRSQCTGSILILDCSLLTIPSSVSVAPVSGALALVTCLSHVLRTPSWSSPFHLANTHLLSLCFFGYKMQHRVNESILLPPHPHPAVQTPLCLLD